MIRKHKALPAYLIVLALFTTYVLMDTFVITRVYSDAAASESSAISIEASDDVSVSNGSDADSIGSESHKSGNPTTAINIDGNLVDSYSDDNISVDLYEFREYDTTIHVADINLSSPEYLKTALAYGQYGRNVKQDTSEIAEDNNAIIAINGDYYGTQERGYVIKNGTLYRDTAASNQEDLVLYADGSYEFINESEVSTDDLMAKGAVQTLSFGPALLENSEITVGENEEISGKSMASNPRTVIGIIDETHYIFMVSDGRTDDSAGLSLYQLAEVMRKLGAEAAYNLDGGGSSTLVFNGEVVNTPTGGHAGHGSGTERSVSDIVYIGK